ncbi:MAG TPA: DHA2 family efflux MFS transporter permease subunit [Kofleriaceae bacterium]|nr:DHA2 family efflux MFS transporter permease subunit [Kofleriaceae bacterium]
MTIATPSHRGSPVRPNLVLAICCMSLLMVSMDATIVNVALPALRRDLGSSTSGLQWVIDAYTMVVASLLMLSGSLADRFGRRRTFQTGMVVFTIASALCSLAPGLHSLIAFRMLQALGASMLNPVAMSIITNTFIEPKARARAIGAWGAVVGISMALGPLVGGGLTQAIGWRSIFWINLPIGGAAIALAQRFVPESKAPRARRIDPVGQLLVLAGLASLTYAVIEGPHHGWTSPLILGLFAVAVGSIAGILIYEPRQAEPLIDLRFFRSVPFTSATVIAVCMFSAFSGFVFLNALYLQEVRLLPAFQTGLYTLPLALATMLCSPISGRLIGRYGTRPSLLIAGATVAISALMLTRLDGATPFAWLIGAYVIFGVGFGLVNAPITNTAVSGMPRAQAGLAAAVASTSRQVGAALGVAIGGTIASAASTGHRAGPEFPAATHAFWWLVAASGALVVTLGLVSTSRWARGSVTRIAALLDEPTGAAP